MMKGGGSKIDRYLPTEKPARLFHLSGTAARRTDGRTLSPQPGIDYYTLQLLIINRLSLMQFDMAVNQ